MAYQKIQKYVWNVCGYKNMRWLLAGNLYEAHERGCVRCHPEEPNQGFSASKAQTALAAGSKLWLKCVHFMGKTTEGSTVSCRSEVPICLKSELWCQYMTGNTMIQRATSGEKPRKPCIYPVIGQFTLVWNSISQQTPVGPSKP